MAAILPSVAKILLSEIHLRGDAQSAPAL